MSAISTLKNAKVLPWKFIIDNIKKYKLIDIRKPEDYNVFHVPEAINIPDVNKELETIKSFHKPVVLTCYLGISSMKAASELESHKIDAFSAEGGMENYQNLKAMNML